MGMTAALAGLATIVGIGAVATQGPALATTTAAATPVAATVGSAAATAPTTTTTTTTLPAASGANPVLAAASATGASPPTSPAAAAPTPGGSASGAAVAPSIAAPASPRCDDGRWQGPGGINVEGQPDGFAAGDRGAVYLWHSTDGWHIRTTDVTNTAHHYTGTVALSAGARFTSFSTVRLESGDRVWVDGDNVLHYDFTTYDHIDGVNFTVSACDASREHESIHFDMDYNGHEDDPTRIALGDTKQHPASANFVVTRSV
jgi:hypothetical protein